MVIKENKHWELPFSYTIGKGICVYSYTDVLLNKEEIPTKDNVKDYLESKYNCTVVKIEPLRVIETLTTVTIVDEIELNEN